MRQAIQLATALGPVLGSGEVLLRRLPPASPPERERSAVIGRAVPAMIRRDEDEQAAMGRPMNLDGIPVQRPLDGPFHRQGDAPCQWFALLVMDLVEIRLL